jgi:hypothetical protein
MALPPALLLADARRGHDFVLADADLVLRPVLLQVQMVSDGDPVDLLPTRDVSPSPPHTVHTASSDAASTRPVATPSGKRFAGRSVEK